MNDKKELDFPFPFTLQSHYYHLHSSNKHIWEKFIRGNPNYFDAVNYSLPLEIKDSWVQNLPPEEKEKFYYLYSYKIDVIAKRGNDIFIIEIKPKAGHIALGQILLYEHLLYENYLIDQPVIKTIITNKAKEGMLPIFYKYNILIFETGVCPDCDMYEEK
jgi:hypothetical protein